MSNKAILILLTILVVVFAFIMTCPNKEDHQSAIANQVTEIIKSDSVASTTGIGLLGTAVISKFVEAAVANMISVNNYFFFSLGTVKYNNEKVLVSIGVMHHVFCLFDKKDLEKFDTGNGGSNADMEEPTEEE